MGFAVLSAASSSSRSCFRPGSGKETGPGGARGGAQDRKAHSVQGKHRAGAKALRQALAAYAGAGNEPATCRLETDLPVDQLRSGGRRAGDRIDPTPPRTV